MVNILYMGKPEQLRAVLVRAACLATVQPRSSLQLLAGFRRIVSGWRLRREPGIQLISYYLS